MALLRRGESLLNNNGGTTSKLLWWVVGLIGSGLVLGVSFFISNIVGKVDSINNRLMVMEVTVATVRESLRSLDDLSKAIRTEQVDRTFRFGDLAVKINSIDSKMQSLEDKYKSIVDMLRGKVDRAQTDYPMR